MPKGPRLFKYNENNIILNIQFDNKVNYIFLDGLQRNGIILIQKRIFLIVFIFIQ